MARSWWPVVLGTELLFKAGEVGLRQGIALLGGLANPADGFLRVFGYALAKVVHKTEPDLRTGMALLGKWPVVPQRRRVILFQICHPASHEVRGERRFGLGLTRFRWPVALGPELLFKTGEAVLRKLMALLGGLAIPLDRFHIVFGDSLAILVHQADHALPGGIALLSGLTIPAEGFRIVFGNAVALSVHMAEPELPIGMALFGEWPKVLQYRCKVTFYICGKASLEVRLKALRCDGLRHHKRED